MGIRIEVSKGLSLFKGIDGYWLNFDSGKKKVAINLVSMFGKNGIIGSCILDWAKDKLEEKEKEALKSLPSEKIIIGQECICPDGLGRVAAIMNNVAGDTSINVNTYVNNKGCCWDRDQVQLISPFQHSAVEQIGRGESANLLKDRFKKQLKGYVQFAFDYENKFIDRFQKIYPNRKYVLESFSMSPICFVKLADENTNELLTFVINLNEYVDWVAGVEKGGIKQHEKNK